MISSPGGYRSGAYVLGFVLALLVHGLVAMPPARACDTPVFVYSLENWNADPFVVEIFHRGPLSASDQRVVDYLEANAFDGKLYANVNVRTVNLAETQSEATQKRFAALQAANLPVMAAYYPPKAGTCAPGVVCSIDEQPQRLCWSGPFTRANVDLLLDSPARQAVARHLLKKGNLVWVLLESGNAGKDNAAYKLLNAELARLCALLKPSGIEGGAELQATYTIVRLSRAATAEKLFVHMLLHSEPDIAQRTDPMAFPIYGRGIALYTLAGAGINDSNIRDAVEFLIGPCSCEVKADNPGTELLMAMNWSEKLMQLGMEGVPTAVGFTAFTENAEKAEQLLAKPAATTPAKENTRAASTPAATGETPAKKANLNATPAAGSAEAASAEATLLAPALVDETPPAPPSTAATSRTAVDGPSPLTQNLLYLLLGGVAVVVGFALAMKLRKTGGSKTTS